MEQAAALAQTEAIAAAAAPVAVQQQQQQAREHQQQQSGGQAQSLQGVLGSSRRRRASVSLLEGGEALPAEYDEPPRSGASSHARVHHQAAIHIATAQSVVGPWDSRPWQLEDSESPDFPFCGPLATPSPVFLRQAPGIPASTVYVAFTGRLCQSGVVSVGIAKADSVRGTYRLISKAPLLHDSEGEPYAAEDPYLWQSARGWHMLIHHTPTSTAEYAFSEDGLEWQLSGTPVTNCILSFDDGSAYELEGCAKQQSLVYAPGQAAGQDQVEKFPSWLISTAESSKPGNSIGAWTVFRKLRTPS